MIRLAVRLLAMPLALALIALPALAAERVLTILAASSLGPAMDALAPDFTRASGIRLRISIAASSILARQIEAGAPADIFISADEAWFDYLVARQRLVPASRVEIASNRLVLIARSDAPNAIPYAIPATEPLANRLGPRGRLAMGDPDHVPAGRYGEAALQALGQWEALAPRLARTENTLAALALVDRGEATLGIVFRSDALLNSRIRILVTFPETMHPPIRYPAGLVEGARVQDDARAQDGTLFLRYLLSPAGQEVFARFGFGQDGR